LNKQVSKNLCILQNASSLSEAVQISNAWCEQGKNVKTAPEKEKEIDITFSAYIFEDDTIEKVRVKNTIKPLNEVKVLILKQENGNLIHYASFFELNLC
jgi:hypothetical protein